ncbi:MAG TPA: Na(+)-translocating NADH-quinone reductase subunit A [Bacteroidales bacterium]|nr:Na(+)-translocating NADH-quinone reductase subunit A [Bacteroidales bacterium]
MSKVYKLHKGLSIPLQGEAERIIHQISLPKTVAVKPTDFVGLVPKLLVKEGDSVLAGDALFVDKNNQDVQFTSPVSGVVRTILRGERRKLLHVEIEAQSEIVYKQFEVPNSQAEREAIVALLLQSGVWPFIKQRPFNCIAKPTDVPKAIHVSAFDTAPLAPDYPFVISENKELFQKGLQILTKLTPGLLHLNILEESRTLHPFDDCCGEIQKNYFSGLHPAGNVGVQIHHIDPINKGDVVWTINPQDVLIIARLFEKGIYDARKIIALTGNIHKPLYVKSIIGASVSDCFEEQLLEKQRIISGNVLTGTDVGYKGFLGFYDSQITVIPEGNKPEFMGWIAPGFEKFSFSRTFFSWLQFGKKYTIDTNLHGGERAFVFTGVYEKVLPMDIYPMQLLKAILVNDIDKMEQLGIYEVVEEDFALCEFVCPSKIEIQSIIRNGLDVIQKEFS